MCVSSPQIPKYWDAQRAGGFTEGDAGISCFPHCGEDEITERARLSLLTQKLLREAREKSKGWVSCSSSDHVDVAAKKVCTRSSDSKTSKIQRSKEFANRFTPLGTRAIYYAWYGTELQ